MRCNGSPKQEEWTNCQKRAKHICRERLWPSHCCLSPVIGCYRSVTAFRYHSSHRTAWPRRVFIPPGHMITFTCEFSHGGDWQQSRSRSFRYSAQVFFRMNSESFCLSFCRIKISGHRGGPWRLLCTLRVLRVPCLWG